MLTEKKQYCNPEIWGGIECTINRVNDQYFDQLECAKYYQNSFEKSFVDLGIKKIRFPVLWEKHQPTIDSEIDWAWAAKELNFFEENNIEVIAGLLHHGSGPSFTNLLDENFPYLFAAYAKKVATQFPKIKYYTPINEPLTTARFSGLYGMWYPHAKHDTDFLKILLNQLKSIVLAMQEIRKINPDAQLVQTEDLAKIYSTPLLQYQVRFENERRWLTYDLLCGKVDENHKLWKHFKRFKIPEQDVIFFKENICIPDIFGFNYYPTSERFLDERKIYPPHCYGGNKRHRYADVEVLRVHVEEETGIELLLKEAWDRYQKPIAITEVHLHCHREEQLRWFKYIWNACLKSVTNGIEIRAVTSWAILGSFGWNNLLTQPPLDYEPGAYDLRSGTPRPTALVSFIKNITAPSKEHTHLTIEKGWWERDSRIIYAQDISTIIKKNFISKSKPIVIIGKRGTLGKAFARVCSNRAINYNLLSRQDCDIADQQSIINAIDLYKPWAIINAAGYVRVDDAEEDKEKCFRENTTGAFNLAIVCKKLGIKLVNFSSDLVFDGEKSSPYLESDEVNPLNVYGVSKVKSEKLVLKEAPASLMIRTSAFFGPWDQYNFLHWVEECLHNNSEIPVANDVYISPTYVPDLVNTTLDLLIDDENGIWHLANKGAISWADLAFLVADRLKYQGLNINSVPASALNLKAARPKYSVLSTEKGHMLPELNHALERYFADKKHNITVEG